MRLKIGARMRPNNEAVTALSYQPVFDATRRVVKVLERWDTRGRVVLQTNASQQQMTAEIAKLKLDIDQANVDLCYLEDTTSAVTAMHLKAADCFRGPYIVDIGFPNEAGDVYSTGMSWRVIWEAERPSVTDNALLAFEETITQQAGGEERVYVGGAINLPERQIGRQFAPYRYTQQGFAVGMFTWPNVPPPIWPFALVRDLPHVTKRSPRVIGNIDSEFEISWQYEYEWHQPLNGSPHRIA